MNNYVPIINYYCQEFIFQHWFISMGQIVQNIDIQKFTYLFYQDVVHNFDILWPNMNKWDWLGAKLRSYILVIQR